MKTASVLTIIGVLIFLLMLALPPSPCAGDRATPAATKAATQTSGVKAIVRRLERRYRSTGSFKAKFKEQITTASGVKREREGTIEYRKPGG